MGEREHPSRFDEQFPHDDILRAVEQAPWPVALASDVAEEVGCTKQTARKKLNELYADGRVEKRDAVTVTLWWVPDDDDDTELATDGGTILAVEGDPDD